MEKDNMYGLNDILHFFRLSKITVTIDIGNLHTSICYS